MAPAGRSREIAHQRQAREQPANRQRDRGENIKRREAKLAASVKQRGVEREGRERRVAAEDAGREKQPPVLRSVALEGEVAGEQSHRQRAGDVLEQRPIRKCRAEEPCGCKVDAVAQCRAEPAAEKDDEEAHAKTLVGRLSPVNAAWAKPKRHAQALSGIGALYAAGLPPAKRNAVVFSAI